MENDKSTRLKWKLIGLLVSGLCCVVLVSGYVIRHRREPPVAANSAPLMNRPLPPANLVYLGGAKLDDQALRNGKVVLVFLAPNCPPCEAEAQFLKSIIDKRKDVTFYGVVSFGTLDAGRTQDKFPFKLLLDQEPRLAGTLGLYRVPIKVFLEDGIIKKSWKGAASNEERVAFAKWLEDLH